ncbi:MULTISPECIES: universal stress protein [Variovorax]|jgi:nucleotide-binding universal stress UspA family protein|uniref:Universal stress protein n=1 Tax=Variovorax ginsengisoli TaxID=363844 RepID=A0ABT8SAV5_9BURK|nr:MULTISPECIES: universal stress protein [Variovorax]MDM0080050.1 universal stress protein [Variovorax sp. J31P179]MDN8615406.1 universal stress protein [Variovorax ginsengisoli]MDO1534576.1 universal stress protein [Variovorax ginsengisoli]
MKILIAVDGSAHTQKAIDYLAKNRAMFIDGNELVVVHVCIGVPGHVTRHLSKEIVRDYYAEETAKVLDPLKATLARAGITSYKVDQRHGHAAEEILKAAADCGAELIVMGTHGHGLFGRALMGSVATKVVAETDISVLLVQ